MSADLERDLLEAGDGLRDVVAALRRAPQAHVPEGFAARVLALLPHEGTLPSKEGSLLPQVGGRGRVWVRRLLPYALLASAASLAIMFASGPFLFRSPAPSQSPNTSQAAAHQAPCQRQDGSSSSSQRPDGTIVANQRPDGSFSDSSAAPYVQAFAVTGLATTPSPDRAALNRAVDALVRTQGADGGGGNAVLSARNVTALAQAGAAGVPRAREARRRGLRYLRLHGIGEISAADLAREAKDALSRLAGSRDAGLVCGVSLASHDMK